MSTSFQFLQNRLSCWISVLSWRSPLTAPPILPRRLQHHTHTSKQVCVDAQEQAVLSPYKQPGQTIECVLVCVCVILWRSCLCLGQAASPGSSMERSNDPKLRGVDEVLSSVSPVMGHSYSAVQQQGYSASISYAVKTRRNRWAVCSITHWLIYKQNWKNSRPRLLNLLTTGILSVLT